MRIPAELAILSYCIAIPWTFVEEASVWIRYAGIPLKPVVHPHGAASERSHH
jgi:hypothetical protein